MDLRADPFRIIESSRANGEIATVFHERMMRRGIFAV
jgi:hypothetical protein